jgi:hypothetical protein
LARLKPVFALTVLTFAASCGGKVEEGNVVVPQGPSLFVDTPTAKRDPAKLGPSLPVPEMVVYLGYFRRHPSLPRSYGAPGETVGYGVAPFVAQVYPWTNADYRACERDGACPSGGLGPSAGEDTEYALVTYETARAACRAHGGEISSAAQLASLTQTGTRRVAWASFEDDVLPRCDRPNACEPYNRNSRDRRYDVEAARGPYGHRGLLGGEGDLVRGFPASYSWELGSGPVRAPSEAEPSQVTVESGDEKPSRLSSPLDELINYNAGPLWAVTSGPAFSDSRGRFRCVFPVR